MWCTDLQQINQIRKPILTLNKYIKQTVLFVPVERKHRHWDGEAEKIQAVQLGIEPRASGYTHQRSDHGAIPPQQQLH